MASIEENRNKTIVIVNDEITQLHVISSILGKEGFRIYSYESAEEALKNMTGHEKPDLIITDIYMPGIDGWNFCRLLRSPEYSVFSATPILVISAIFSGDHTREITEELGANAFLASPFKASQLKAYVYALLEGKNFELPSSVLIIEDSISCSTIIKQPFEKANYNVYIAETGEEGKRLFNQYLPDLAIIDYYLPDLLGDKLINEFRKLNPRVIIIMITSDSTPTLATDFIQKGANGYARKPFEPDYLMSLCQMARRERSLLRVQERLEERTKELQESENRYRNLFNEMLNGFALYEIICNNEGNPCDYRFLDINPAFEKFTGLKKDNLIGKNILDVFPETEEYRISEYGKVALTGKPVHFVNYSGELDKWLEVIAYSPKEKQFATIFTDITERKLAQDALKESEEKLKSVITSAKDCIFMKDKGLKYTFANPSIEKLFNLPANQIIGKSNKDFLREEEVIEINEIEMEVLHGKTIEREETLYIHGNSYIFHTVRTPMKRSDGEVFGLCGIARDITDRKKLEEQLIQAQKMEAIGQLAGGVAHDFNNILAGILGYANLIKMDAPGNSSFHKAASKIERAAERASDLTKQLLGFARRGKYQNINLDLQDTINEVVSLLNRTVDKNIIIVQKLRAQHTTVKGDPAQIHQVLLNLAVNARDAMPTGGELTITTERNFIDENYCQNHIEAIPGDYIVISITDTGIGIPKEHIEHIFEPFFTTKEVGKGTGMGLAMVYGIIKNHDGFIQVQSEAGHGSTFKVFLPFSGSKRENSPDKPEEKIISGTGIILLVDDEEILREMAVEMLERLNYTVITLEDGQSAIDYYKRNWQEIDLVILDMIMPKIGGLECFLEMKKINPEIKAILSTGYSVSNKTQDIINEGMMGFIQKPYHLGEMANVIARVMETPSVKSNG